MLLKINKYKKIIEHKELFSILKNKKFFTICLKKNNSIKQNMELENDFKQILNIKTLNKNSLKQVVKNTPFKNMFNFLDGSVVLISPKNDEINIFDFFKKVETIKNLSVITCFFENKFYSLDNIRILLIQKKVNEFNLFWMLKNKVKDPLKLISSVQKSPFFLLKNRED